MNKKKSVRILLKRKLHPFLSYAVLFGVGAIAISSTGTLTGANLAEPLGLPPSATAAPIAAAKPATPPADLAKLKATTSEFAAQLAVIKAQIGELEKYGRTAPPKLTDAIGQADQLVAFILSAPTLESIGFDAAAKLQMIGAAIAANAKF